MARIEGDENLPREFAPRNGDTSGNERWRREMERKVVWRNGEEKWRREIAKKWRQETLTRNGNDNTSGNKIQRKTVKKIRSQRHDDKDNPMKGARERSGDEEKTMKICQYGTVPRKRKKRTERSNTPTKQ